ncbi:MAG TPA: AsmA family protein [Terriglobales bacterium]|nr:AsmA family protein [Terriglobales bacterium]
MKKKALIIAGAVIAVLILAVVALPLFVDVDRFRPVIQTEMSSALGREVQIRKLGFSLLAGGITAEDVSIADDPGFSQTPFVRAKSLAIGVDVMPLILSHALHVRTFTIQHAEVTLLKNPAGKWNFSSLGSAEKSKEKPSSSAADFSVDVLKIKDSRLTVGRAGARGKTHTYEDVNLTVHDLSLTSSMPFKLDARTPGGGTMKLEGKAGPVDRTDAARTPLNAQIAVEHMDLASTGFLDPASGIAGTVDYTGKITSDGTTAEAEGKATASKLKLVRSGGPARQPLTFDYAASLDLERQAGTLTRGDIHVGKSLAKLTGNFETRGESPVVHMKLRALGLPVNDVESALPAVGVSLPSGSSLQGGTATANLSIDGPIDRLVITGPVHVANSTLKGFNLGSKLGGLGALAGARSGADTAIQTLASSVRVGPEGIRADGLTIIVPSMGTVTGAGTISPSNALNFKMNAKLTSGAGSMMSGMSQITSLGKSKGNVPFLIQGTTSAPIFLPDVAGAVTNTVAAPVQGVGSVLGGVFGKKKKP